MVFSNEYTEAVFNAIKRDRQSFAKWAESIDCLLIDEDIPDYREAYDCPAELGRESARVYILAEMLDAHYDEYRPELESPYSAIFSIAYVEINWIDIAKALIERVRHELQNG